MFTGIVTDVGRVAAVSERDHVRRLSVECGYDAGTIAIGASIACAGICLTVISREAGAGGGAMFDVELAPETLRVTSARHWKTGTRLNLERSLRIGDELGGHMMSGHVDGLAEITKREELGDASRFTFEAPVQLAKFIAPKGSVALDGTSLTVNGVFANRFDCVFIPHTLEVTTWGERRVGDYVNLEADQIARYVARLSEAG
jgi:riboflavin synthase